MRNERGITLIALVVTIVVLLILAGVTITYALGDNGLFDSANKAELASVKSTFTDAISNAQAECLIKSYDTEQTVPTEAAGLLTLVKNYLPDAWKKDTTSTDLAFTSNKLAGTISTTVNGKTYTVTVENGAVKSVEKVQS